ncbi:T9SS type A sorting domain-containing protein [Hymenobacter gummosus]|uniref:T9SS type A sorting domain-containing protein n=1 Tax=Hymenobacter gummosus TaxID=1776032 RepID=UPI001404790E|nr:T9SS type A sorting domain-containing protein [Hymenobacter gummosus]
MKKLALLALVAAPLSGWAQTTYTWVGGNGANWSTAANWSPNRGTRLNTDILVFNGGTPAVTLDIDDAMRRLTLANGAAVTLNLPAPGNSQEITRTFTITGDGTGAGNVDDFVVAPGTSLTVLGAGANGNSNGHSLNINLNTGATGTVGGGVVFDGANPGGNSNTRILHRFTAPANSLTFQSGGSLSVVGARVPSTAAPFGSTNGVAVFQSGSSFLQEAGADPYGPATFQTGSTYRFTGGAVPASLEGRTYGNLVYAYPTNAGLVYGGTSRLTVLNDLILASTNQSSVSLNITGNATGGVAIGGNITVDGGGLSIQPNADVNLTLNGTTPQTIQGAGSIAINASTVTLLVNNANGVTLLKPLTFKGLNLTSGVVTTSTGNPLTIALSNSSNGSSLVTGGSATSFVNGPLTVTASGANSKVLAFPVGAFRNGVGVYRPINLSLTQTSATGTYTAQQVEGGNAAARPFAATLQRVSGVRLFSLSAPGTTFNTGSITLNYGADDQVTDGATLRLARSIGGGTWENLGGTGSGAPTGTINVTGLTALGDFVLATTSSNLAVNPLPVELSAFTGKRTAAGAVLNWTTAQEINNDRFEVQRSLDGKAFLTIGSVKGQGQSTRATSYSFLDRDPLTKAAFYRLRQIDHDGTTTDSHAVLIAGGDKLSISTYPNPAQDELFVLAGEEPVQWRLLNLMGQPLRNGKVQGRTTVDLHGLPAGSYYLEVGQGRQRTVHTVVKTN